MAFVVLLPAGVSAHVGTRTSSTGIQEFAVGNSSSDGRLLASIQSWTAGRGPTVPTALHCELPTRSSASCAAGTTGRTPSEGGWSQVDAWPVLSENANPYHAQFVDDPADGYDLLVGGTTAGASWSYLDGSWTEQFPSFSPSTGSCSGLTYDVADHEVVCVGDDPLNETWTYGGGEWTRLNLSAAPPKTDGFAFGYDSAASTVLLFGGIPLSGTYPSNATWSFTGGAWKLDHPARSPPARSGAFLSDDPSDGYSVLFGGSGLSSGLPTTFGDTWAFSAGNWTPIPTGVTPPNPSGWSEFTYDPAESGAVLFGPCIEGCDSPGETQIWTFRSGEWYNMTADLPTSLELDSSLAVATDGSGLVALGGETRYSSGDLTAVWTLGRTGWTNVAEPRQAPSSSIEMVDDPALGEIVALADVTGGFYGPGQFEEWAFSSGQWSLVSRTLPMAPRSGEGLTYDAAGGFVLLFGGVYYDSSTDLGDTWIYEGARWTQVVQPPGAAWPMPQFGSLLDYDASDGYAVLADGSGPGVPSNESWAFRGGSWAELPFAPRGLEFTSGQMAYDSSSHELVFFGSGRSSNGTWVFDRGSWENVTQSGISPPGRTVASMVDDPQDGGVLLFGGNCVPNPAYGGRGGCPPLGDTWLFDHGYWVDVTDYFPPAPAPRNAAGTVLDLALGTQGEPMLSGGSAGNDTWVWTGAGSIPIIASFSFAPASVALGSPTRAEVGASEPGSQLTYAFAGLPQGCRSSNLSSLRCVPTSTGSYLVHVRVTDASHHSNESVATLTVTWALWPGHSTAELLMWIGGAGTGACVAAVAAVRWRRARREAATGGATEQLGEEALGSAGGPKGPPDPPLAG
ncbi:MAG TPA: hypothetical protein VGS23_02950 [Thermoplasmata archaeon]|nr:hypothetical protein [Thermoplasmata archaeon]